MHLIKKQIVIYKEISYIIDIYDNRFYIKNKI